MKELTVTIFFILLILVAWSDIKTMEIPDLYSFLILLSGILSIKTMPGLTIAERIAGMGSVSGFMILMTLLVPGSFGGGDMKLVAASGLLLGWKKSLAAFFLAVLTGGCYGIFLLISGRKRRKEHFAFGPFLCLGMAVSVCMGETILDWYLGICGW